MENNRERSVMMPCRWCDKPLLPVNKARYGVCADCYRLLHGAGITDEEIFGGEQKSGREDVWTI